MRQPPYKREALPLIFVLTACNTFEQVGSSSFPIQYCSKKAAPLIFSPLTTMLYGSSTWGTPLSQEDTTAASTSQIALITGIPLNHGIPPR